MASHEECLKFFKKTMMNGECVTDTLLEAAKLLFSLMVLMWYCHQTKPLIFIIVSIIFLLYVIMYSVRLWSAIWVEVYAALGNAMQAPTAQDQVQFTYSTDNAPFPATHRLFHLQNDMEPYWHSMFKQSLYLRHYQRHHKQNNPLDICCICRDPFTPDALQNDTFITKCGHLFHRVCLWQWCSIKCRHYWYYQRAPCPLDDSNIRLDYFTQLYEPNYVRDHYGLILLLDKAQIWMDIQFDLECKFGSIWTRIRQYSGTLINFVMDIELK